MNLTLNEVSVIQMALQTMIEDMEAVSKDPTIPFTPQARKETREILESSKSALNKIRTVSGHQVILDPYKPGDEEEFLTKQS